MFDVIFWVKDLVGDPIFFTSLGMLIGWNAFQQPAWVKKTVNWVVDRF